MINNVTLTGRLTKDPELKHSQSGTAFANATLAVERNYKNQQGERESDFIRLSASGKRAETLANYFKKGDLLGAEGRLRTYSYDNQQGQKTYVTEVAVDSLSFLQPKSQRQQGPSQQSNYGQYNDYNAGQQGNNAQYEGYNVGQPIDIPDSDIPF